MTTQTAPNLANSGTRPCTVAERAVLPRIRRNDVARILEAPGRYAAHSRTAGVLTTAAYWIAAGAVDEAHQLIAEAAAAHREAVTDDRRADVLPGDSRQPMPGSVTGAN